MTRKTVLITGATDGLGKALAIAFSKDYDLALCGRSQEKMDSVLSLLDSSCSTVHQCFDLLDEEALHSFCNDVKSVYGNLDILINNAGANLKKEPVAEMSIDLLRRMLELNCITHLEMIQEFYPVMKEQNHGMIINILSSCCLFHNPNMAGYTASKDAMDAISKSLLKEAKDDNIKVMSVYPGGIDTAFRAVANHTYMKPESVAEMILQAAEAPEDAAVQELVIRPMIESNIQ